VHTPHMHDSVHRYNPEHDTESRLLRHRAAALQDLANSYLDHDLSEDFDKVHCFFACMYRPVRVIQIFVIIFVLLE